MPLSHLCVGVVATWATLLPAAVLWAGYGEAELRCDGGTVAANSSSWASTPVRRRIMQSNRSRDTSPEIAVRRLLFARGLRYRVDRRPIAAVRRRADIVFLGVKLAVFIDGCFWHGCPEHGTTDFHTNAKFWRGKLETNAARDRDTNAQLEQAGWSVLRVWEHVAPIEAANQIEATVRTLRGQ